MSEEKTYVIGEPTSGTDPATLMAMCNNGNCGNNWIWILFMFMLYGWGGNGGFGNNKGLGTDLLMQAINGNNQAVSQLASTLNCDINSIRDVLSNLQTGVQSVGSTVGMSGQQVINAIQSGNQALASQLSQCCCDNKLLVTTQGYENRLANQEQTAILGSKIDTGAASINGAIAAQTTLINDKFCSLEMREMQNKINSLLEEKNALKATIDNANQTAQIQGYVNSLIQPLTSEVSAIKAGMPQTVTLPYNQAIAVPNPYLYTGSGSIWS